MPLQLHASPCQSAVSCDVTIHMNERLELMRELIEGRSLWETRIAASKAWNSTQEDGSAACAMYELQACTCQKQPSIRIKKEGSIAIRRSLDDADERC